MRDLYFDPPTKTKPDAIKCVLTKYAQFFRRTSTTNNFNLPCLTCCIKRWRFVKIYYHGFKWKLRNGEYSFWSHKRLKHTKLPITWNSMRRFSFTLRQRLYIQTNDKTLSSGPWNDDTSHESTVSLKSKAWRARWIYFGWETRDYLWKVSNLRGKRFPERWQAQNCSGYAEERQTSQGKGSGICLAVGSAPEWFGPVRVGLFRDRCALESTCALQAICAAKSWSEQR